jgi:(p)ppGpp synthase/HD superfamily hydrolase
MTTPTDKLIADALVFATACHATQYRKHDIAGVRVPYIMHPLEVFKMVWAWTCANAVTGPAALLHDVAEDCGVSFMELNERFGRGVESVVYELTLTPGEKATPDYFRAFETKSVEALVVKLADRLCNTQDYVITSGGYAGKYLAKARPLFCEVLPKREEEILVEFGVDALKYIQATAREVHAIARQEYP